MSAMPRAGLVTTSTHDPRPQDPLLVVLGATGTGKSQLAVELAKRFNGEVINGDAMQLYAGLPIITNKITPDEQQGIPHHLLGCIDLHEPTWVVSTFVKRAGDTIAEIRARGRLPILVGGTHYYTQSLLFRDALVDAREDDSAATEPLEPIECIYPILAEPTEVIMAELKRIDPVMAAKWHPNDRRKIQRSLMIFLQTGKTASQTYHEQQRALEQDSVVAMGDLDHASRLRYNTLFFWVHTAREALQLRLNDRVDTMLNGGLLEEVESLHDYATRERAAGRTIDETKGIWVSIGYKEFSDYQDKRSSSDDQQEISRALAAGIERTKIANRQYAKRQITWIKHKLTQALAAADAEQNLYVLDSTVAAEFGERVVLPAAKLTEQFLSDLPRPDPKEVSSVAEIVLGSKRHVADWTFVAQACAACNVTCTTQDSWEAHVRSKKHKKLSKSADPV